MRKPSRIVQDIIVIADLLIELDWKRIEARGRLGALQKELKHFIKYNRTIKIK